MEILNHGKNYTTSKCEKCDCTFGYCGPEVITYSSIDTIDGLDYSIKKAFINCPECGTPIILQNEVTVIKGKEAKVEAEG